MIKAILILLYLLPSYLNANEVCDKILKSVTREETTIDILNFDPEIGLQMSSPLIQVNIDLKDINISNQSSITDLGFNLTTSWKRENWIHNFKSSVLLYDWNQKNPAPPIKKKNKYNPGYGNWINEKEKVYKTLEPFNCYFERSSEVTKLLDKIWHPEAFTDEIGSNLEIKNYKELHITNDRIFKYNFLLSSDVIFQVKNQDNFSKFPFDDIEVRANLNFKEVNISPNIYIPIPAINTAKLSLEKQWFVLEHGLELISDNNNQLINQKISYWFKLKRESFFYIYKIIAPIILITFLSFCNVFIRPKEIEAKLNLTVGSLLSLIAFNFVFGEDIPKLNSLTVLDQIILTSYFFAFLSTVFAIVSSSMHFKDNEKVVFHPLSNYRNLILPLSYIVVLIITVKLNLDLILFPWD